MLTIKMILVFVLVFIAWMAVEIMINRLVPLVKEGCAAVKRGCVSRRKSETDEQMYDPSEAIDFADAEIDEAVKAIRMPVAQAITTEKHLELQIQSNLEKAAAWENRASLAIEQDNPELAEQANQRRKQLLATVEELKEQLETAKKTALLLRQQLNVAEGELLRFHTRKNLLKARHSTASAVVSFNKHFAALLTTYALAQNKLVEEKLHGIIDEMPAGLMVVDSSGQILAVNPQIAAMTGISADDMCHKISADTIFMHSDQATLSSRIKEIAGKGIYSTHVRTNNEAWTPADVTISKITSGDYIICVLDATTRTKL